MNILTSLVTFQNVKSLFLGFKFLYVALDRKWSFLYSEDKKEKKKKKETLKGETSCIKILQVGTTQCLGSKCYQLAFWTYKEKV